MNPSTKIEFSSLDPLRLRGRGVFAVRLPAPVSRWEVVRSSVLEAVKWFRHRPVSVAAPEKFTARENAFPEYCHYQFSEEESRRIRETAMRHSVTVNDLLLRDMFLTVKAWNTRYRPHAKAEWLRINMPTSLRGHNETSMPAANRMSFAFLTRNERDCDNGDTFLAGIRWETKMIQRLEPGPPIPQRAAIRPVRAWPVETHLGRAVVSCLGDLVQPRGSLPPFHHGAPYGDAENDQRQSHGGKGPRRTAVTSGYTRRHGAFRLFQSAPALLGLRSEAVHAAAERGIPVALRATRASIDCRRTRVGNAGVPA